MDAVNDLVCTSKFTTAFLKYSNMLTLKYGSNS